MEPGYQPRYWREYAECYMTDVDMFPSDKDEVGVAAAKLLCENCVAVRECLEFAVETEQPDGIWGGMTIDERKKYARFRRKVS